MPIYTIKAPNGIEYEIEGPPGASQAQVAAAVLARNPEAGQPPKQAPMSFGDTAISAAQSGLGALKSMVSGVGGVDTSAYRGLGALERQLGEKLSPERRAEIERREILMRQAAERGDTLGEAGAALGAVTEAPVQSTAQALGSALPTVAAGMGVAALGAAVGAPVAIAAAVGLGTKLLLGYLQGAGETKGSIYENVQKELIKSGMDPEKAKQQALAAQEYLGKNWGNIQASGALGAVGAGTGLEKVIPGKLSKQAAAQVGKKSTVLGAGVAEALPEAAQAVQTQRATNIAQTREGVETPEWQGTVGAGIREGLMGGIAGSAAQAIPGRSAEQAAQPAPAPGVDPEQRRKALEAIRARKAVAPLYPEGGVAPEAPATVEPAQPPVEPTEPVPEPKKRVEPATTMRAPFADLITEKEMGPTTANWAKTPAGKQYLTKLSQLDPATAREQRSALVPKKNQIKADIFDRVFPEPVAAEPAPAPAPVEAAPAPVEAEPTQAPAPAPVEAAPAPVEAAPVELQDRLAYLDARISELSPFVYNKPRRNSPDFAAWQRDNTERSALMEERAGIHAALRQQAPAPVEPAPVEPAPVEPAPVEPAPVEPAPVEPAPVEPAPVEPASRPSDSIMDEVRALETEQRALLTKAGNRPAQNSKAGARWDALADQIEAKKAEWAAADRAERTKALEPKAVEPAPVEPEYATAADWWADQMEGAEPDIGAFESLRPENQATLEAWFEEGALTGADADRVLAAERAGQDFNPARFRRTERATGGMRKDEAQAVADAVRARWQNAPAVKVVESMDDPDVPQSVRDEDARQRAGGAKGEPQAFWDKGTAYLVAGQVNNATEAMTAMFHEILGHYGLRGVFGKALDPILKQIANARRADVDAVAKKYGLDTGKESDRMVAAEEVLANLAQTQPELGFVKRAVAAIRSWLRQNVPGFQNLKLTDAEIINDFILPARWFVESGQRAKAPVAGKAAMSRKQVDPELREWAKGILHKEKGPVDLAKDAVDATVEKLAKRKDGVGLIDIVRSKVADRLAVVETRINREIYNNMPKDVLGNTSSVVKARQADDVGKLMMAMFDEGTLRISPDSGMLEVVPLDKPANSMNGVLLRWGEQNGLDFNEAKATASRILEAVRANELIKANASGEADVLIHIRKPSGAIDYDLIAKAVEQYNSSPELQELSDIMDGVRVPVIDELYTSGRLTAEQARKLREVAFYVPFDRLDEGGVEKVFRELKKPGKSGYSALMRIPELKGSVERQVGDVFENYYRTMTWLASELAKQNAASSLMTDLESIGVAEKITEAQAKNTPYVAKVYEKGEVQYFKLPSKYDLIPFLDRQNGLWAITGPLAKIANVLRLSITANPVFAASQVVMDVQGALIFADVKNPVRFIAAVAKDFGKVAATETYNAARAMFGKPPIIPELERQMSRIGLAGEIDYVYANPALDALYEAGLRQRRLFGSTTAGAVFHSLQQISHGADLAVRKALYDDAMRTYKDPIMASTKARELINFRRRGSSEVLKNLVPMVPFLNAYIQATDLVYRSVTGKGNIMGRPAKEARKRLLAATTMYAGLAFIYAMANSSDDNEDVEFRQLDERTKNNNWLLPGGIRIRVRGDYGIIKVSVEKAVEWWTRQGKPDELAGKQAFKLWWNAAVDAYGMKGVPVPAALAPLMELMTNYSSFTGRQLIGTYQSKLDASRQITSNTSEIAKTVAEWTRETTGVEVSPIHIDHAIRGYFGTVGATVAMVTDRMLNPDRLDRPIHKTAVLGAFTWDDTQRTGPTNETYELAKELDQRKKTYDDLLKYDPAAAEAYLKKHQEELEASAYTNQILLELGALRARMNYLDSKRGVLEIPDKAEREAEAKALRERELEITSGIREFKKEVDAALKEGRASRSATP